MGKIPQAFLDQLLARTDIVDVVDRVVPLKKTGANYSACCPFHQEKSPSFTVSPNKQFYHCFGCGANGNAIGFLMNYDRLEFLDAVEQLAKEAGLEVPRDAKPQAKKETQLYDLMEAAANYYQEQLKQSPATIDYLKQRGISGQTAKTFQIGYAKDAWQQVQSLMNTPESEWVKAGLLIRKETKCYDRFRNRLIFPIRDRRGRVIAFGGRVLDDSLPKYLNSPETPIFHKGQELYGLYEARKANRELASILIVEGYMDVIGLAEHGVTNAVATLGTATTEYHLKTLLRNTQNLIFCFDGDNAGRKAAWRALEIALPLMEHGISVQFMFLQEGEDPDSFIKQNGKEAFDTQLKQAQTLANFFFHHLAENIDFSNPEGRARFVELAKPYIDRVPAGVYQNMLLEELGKRTRTEVKTTEIKTKIQKHSTRGKPSAMRTAITLLVQYPNLAKEIELSQRLNLNGSDVLHAVLNTLKESPELNTATLLERFRDNPMRETIAKLASAELSIPEAGIELELKDAIQQLIKQDGEQIIEGLMAKAAQGALSDEEKRALQDMLIQKNS